jgi:peptidoglycan/xylan/chitin deacetylase (PgdA/CDA1 family)
MNRPEGMETGQRATTKEDLQRRFSYSALGPFRQSFREGMPVLAYHKLGPLPSGAKVKSFYVGEELFAWQIRDLHRGGFLVRSLNYWRRNLPPNRRRAVLTFDDGSRTVLRHGLPALTRHRIRAIQFLVVDALGGINHWDVRSRGETPDTLMNLAEVREWLSGGQEIGSHTLTHANLTAIDEAKAREEISASKKKLEDLFGVAIRHFCYPYGKWSPRVRDLVEEAGYETAVTLEFGVNAEGRDPFTLRRIGVKHPSPNLRNLATLLPAGFPIWFFWQP